MILWIPNNKILLLWSLLLLAGKAIEGRSYNYSASIECLADPLDAQYGGGGLENPSFEKDLGGWNVHGKGMIEVRRSKGGNQFIVAYNRSQPHDSFSKPLQLEKGMLYTFSAWVQINEGKEIVLAAFRHSQNQTIIVGSIVAQSGCWTMLRGGFTVDLSMTAELYFESDNSSIELWVDNISLQPFTQSQWKEQQYASIEKIRKRKLRLYVSDKQGKNVQGAPVMIMQVRANFPLGCATSKAILSNQGYQNWFTSRFTATTFDNEMKWYYTEAERGRENYSVPDAMLAFFKGHRIAVRGHNILWDEQNKNPRWVQSLSPGDLLDASMERILSVVKRYSGQVIAWDVMNENLHFSFFEDKIGPNATAFFFNTANKFDSKATMFLNDYCTIEHPDDMKANPLRYVEKLKEIKSYPGNEGMVVGIGLEAHFVTPNIPYMRATLDALGGTKMPIWLTELSVKRGPHQAEYLEEIMREAYAHPAVEGIIVWPGAMPLNCGMCLTDKNLKNLPAGDVVDKLINEWKTNAVGMTNDNGLYENHVFHGEYIAMVFNPYTGENVTRQFEVSREDCEALNVTITI